MGEFDLAALSFVNGFAGESPSFDLVVLAISRNHLFKTAPIMALLWLLWFRFGSEGKRSQMCVVGTLAAGALSLFCARALSLALPFRPRPVAEPEVGFVLPYGSEPAFLTTWSAFPSDHGALFMALTASLFLLSRPIGVAMLLHASVVVWAPRIYLGLHYPSDILSGALLGAVAAYVVAVKASSPLSRATDVLLAWARDFPGPFYAGFFLLTFEVASMFEHVRTLGSYAVRLVGLWMGGSGETAL